MVGLIGLQVTGYELRVSGYALRVAGYGVRVAGCEVYRKLQVRTHIISCSSSFETW